MTKEAFIQVVTADQREAPAYFTYDAMLNSEERPTLDQALEREMKPLALDVVLELQAKGAQVLDTRDPDEFGAAHLAGSINVGLGGQYATWAGTILNRNDAIVIIADPGREYESAVRLGRIGFDHVAGYLRDGLNSLKSRPELIAFDGSVGIPLNRLVDHWKELPKDRSLLVYCAGGYRSSIAASLLQGRGFGPVAEIAGGFAAWEAAKLPVCRAQV